MNDIAVLGTTEDFLDHGIECHGYQCMYCGHMIVNIEKESDNDVLDKCVNDDL